MNIDISEIVNKKIAEMESDRTIEKLVTSEVEKAVTEGVKNAINGYSVRNSITDMIENDVKSGIEKVGLTAYNSMVTEQVGNLINSVLKDDIAAKCEKIFQDVILNNRKTVKLSEIAEKYKEEYEDDESSKAELSEGHFYLGHSSLPDGSSWKDIRFCFAEKEQTEENDRDYNGPWDKKLVVSLFQYMDKNPVISSVSYEDHDMHDISRLSYMSDFEAFMLGLFLNRTHIEMDIDFDDIDTCIVSGCECI